MHGKGQVPWGVTDVSLNVNQPTNTLKEVRKTRHPLRTEPRVLGLRECEEALQSLGLVIRLGRLDAPRCNIGLGPLKMSTWL